ncbi:MAG TPA: hypothetical protein VF613_06000 [Longimicrobium sp.]|jgi:hypothetical protein
MHRTVAALSLATLAACAGSAGTSAPATSAAPTVHTGTFIQLRGTDTIARETFTRTATRLQADMRMSGDRRMAYTSDLAADASVTRVELRAYSPGADTTAAQRAVVTLRGDSATLEVTPRGGAANTERFSTTAGAVGYVNPSPSSLEQIVRRARAIGGDSVQVQIVGVPGRQTRAVNVRFVGADSAIVSLGGVALHLRTDRAGSMLGGSVPSQGLVITRVP